MSMMRDLLMRMKSPTAYELILKQMATEMPDMRDSIRLWYSPSIQAISRNGIIDTEVLKDLTGNGADVTMTTKAIIDGEYLSFDEEHGYGEGTCDFNLSNCTFIINTKDCQINRVISLYHNSELNTKGIFEMWWQSDSNGALNLIMGKNSLTNWGKSYARENGIKVITPTRYKSDYSDVSFGSSFESYYLNKIKINKAKTAYTQAFKMKTILVFDKELTDEEIEWCKTNMNV